MAELIEAGADVFRLNFSHGTEEDHAENVARAREAAERTGKQVGILGDLPGPKLRIGDVDRRDRRPAPWQRGDAFDRWRRARHGGATADLLRRPPRAVAADGLVYLADGRIRLRVLDTGETEVRCAVEVGGRVSSHQGLNLPGADVALPAAGREDLAWVDFAVDQGIDLLAVSFVRRAEDLEPVERRIRTGGSDIPLIAKIEKPQAAERAEEIVKAVTAGVMVARGDLGIELPIEQVPTVQRRLLALAGKYSRASITATQMLASMVASTAPDARRGLRRRQRDLSGHRRGDALRGDRRRPVSGRGGPGDGPVAREAEPGLPYGRWVFNRVDDDP